MGIVSKAFGVWTPEDYDPKPYLAAFTLEWAVLGRCPLGDAVRARGWPDGCGYEESSTDHKCGYISGRSWAEACDCGPLFVKKYGLKKKGGGKE